MISGIQVLQPGTRVGQPDPLAWISGCTGDEAGSAILHRDDAVAAFAPCANLETSALRLARDSMPKRIFHQGLQEHVRNQGVQCLQCRLNINLEAVRKADLLDLEIASEEIQLCPERNLL